MELTVWLYILTATLLIVHEIDSGYWKEWDLFKLPGGASFFMLIHIPVIAIILFGLVETYKNTMTGTIISIILAAAGIAGFCLHAYFLLKGSKQFNTWVSKAILFAMLISSLALLFYRCVSL